MSIFFLFGLMIISLWNTFPPVCGIFCVTLSNFDLFRFLYFWPPLGSALRHKCFVCLPEGILDSSSPECTHRHPFFFVLCPLSLPFPFLPVPVPTLSHCVGPSSVSAMSHGGAPPFQKMCRRGLSLHPPLCAIHSLFVLP